MMMNRKIWISLLLSSLLSFTAYAEDLNIQFNGGEIIQFTRGKSVTLEELSTVADLSTARDQKGNHVTLEEANYTVASYTRATITVEPPSGSAADVITLDLKAHAQ